MGADKPINPILRVNPAQEAFDRTQAAYAAKRACKLAESDALNRIRPSTSEKSEAVWQRKGGSTGDEQTKSLPTGYPRLSGG